MQVRITEYRSFPGLRVVEQTIAEGDGLVVRGGAAHWPAAHKYSLEYFDRECGDADVFVRGGRYAYKVFGIVSLREFIAYLRGQSPWLGGAEQVHRAVSAHPTRDGKPIQLYSVYGLFLDRAPWLADDLRFLDYMAPTSVADSPTWWIGDANCETPFHTDLNGNIFAQIVGRKRFELLPYDPSVNARMEVLRCFEPGTYYSAIDFAGHPEARKRFPELVTIDLDPGDVLALPPMVWHEVTSLTMSISVQTFFDPWRDVRQTARRWRWEAKRVLHLAGLYCADQCTCHATPEIIGFFGERSPAHHRWAARIGRLRAHGRQLSDIAGW